MSRGIFLDNGDLLVSGFCDICSSQKDVFAGLGVDYPLKTRKESLKTISLNLSMCQECLNDFSGFIDDWILKKQKDVYGE